MTERWQREIRRLRELRPRADLDQRVAEGSHGDAAPPVRQRVIAAVTALAVFAALIVAVILIPRLEDPRTGGTDVVGGDEQPLVLNLRSQNDGPVGILLYDDALQFGVVEGSTWCVGEECSSMTADFAFFPPVNDFLLVPPGTPIEVTGTGTVDELRALDPDGGILVEGIIQSLPDADGRYVLGVGATWSEGDQTGTAAMFFGVQVVSSIDDAPDVLHVDCSAGVARTDSAIVRALTDGVHFEFTGTEGFTEFGIIHFSSGMGGSLVGDGPQVMPVPPGPWEVGCGTGERPVELGLGELTAAFEVVDPGDHYAPIDIGCFDRTAREFTSRIPGDVPAAEAAGRLLDGLGPGDRLPEAGYHSEAVGLPFVAFVVIRGQEAVARITLQAGTTWRGTFESCRDSGITLSESETEPASVPDLLVLRCEGFGPAAESDTVRLQPDGLHLEVTNVADATVVALVPGSEPDQIVFPFTQVTERYIVDVPEGPLWIGCRIPDEQGNIDGGPSEVPDAYVRVMVLQSDA